MPCAERFIARAAINSSLWVFFALVLINVG
jgi:hypothetical protein